MKHEKIDSKARVWTVVRGPDGRLHDQLDPRLLAGLENAQSADEISEAIVLAAGAIEIAQTRAW